MCIFCKINDGTIPAAKIRENDEFIAVLDAFPACKGHTLVMSKKHYGSDIFVMDNEIYSRLMLAVKEVVALLKKGLSVDRIGVVIEGLEVDHAHVKLYPFRGGKSFQGGLNGQEMAQLEDLQKIANEINS